MYPPTSLLMARPHTSSPALPCPPATAGPDCMLNLGAATSPPHLPPLHCHAAVPDAAAVASALPTDAMDAAGVASLAAIDRLAALLEVPAYT
jgi:hypothetical protein